MCCWPSTVLDTQTASVDRQPGPRLSVSFPAKGSIVLMSAPPPPPGGAPLSGGGGGVWGGPWGLSGTCS